MSKRITIASDATPSTGAGVIVIREHGETTRYDTTVTYHNYGPVSTVFEIKNAVNTLKVFKKYLDSESIVKFYCDNASIISEYSPNTHVFSRQVEQVENSRGCVIEVYHDTIRRGNIYINAANELSRERAQSCAQILEGIGAKHMFASWDRYYW